MINALESWPEYGGGFSALKEMIDSNLIYPSSAVSTSIEGKVFVEFWVDTCGITSDHRILKGLHKDLDEEALRVARLIKFSKPAMQAGKPVNVKFVLPFEFKLPKQ
jgi:TonB family protein